MNIVKNSVKYRKVLFLTMQPIQGISLKQGNYFAFVKSVFRLQGLYYKPAKFYDFEL